MKYIDEEERNRAEREWMEMGRKEGVTRTSLVFSIVMTVYVAIISIIIQKW